MLIKIRFYFGLITAGSSTALRRVVVVGKNQDYFLQWKFRDPHTEILSPAASLASVITTVLEFVALVRASSTSGTCLSARPGAMRLARQGRAHVGFQPIAGDGSKRFLVP